MKLHFWGADREVTGSCHGLEVDGKTILIDCGMRQGQDAGKEEATFPFSPGEIDLVILTHAHIDHSGLLPLLVKQGFTGRILATAATCELCSIMLRDSAHIQEFEAEWRNRKGQRAGKEPYEPLYTMEDAEAAIALFEPYGYGEKIEVCAGISLRFADAGHLLGSASAEVWVKEGEEERKLVFSGDIGNFHQPLIRDPSYIKQADYVVMESTYGDRTHKPAPDYCRALANIIQTTFDKGGNVVIPSFAVGRTQEMLYFLREIIERGMVKGHDIPVYVDSPLANEATNIFSKHMQGYYDEEAMALVNRGINPIGFAGLHTSVTSEDSKAINFIKGSKVILSASGMCEAGRIKHHLKHNLWRAESTVVFVGYQANGTLGRSLLEGAKDVKLFGEEIEVKADIIRLEGVSGHADKYGLTAWIQAFETPLRQVFVVHGENTVCEEFTRYLGEELGFAAAAPYYQACYNLLSGVWEAEGAPRPLKEKSSGGARKSAVFARLLAAGQRLLAVIRKNEQGTNKDLAKFADQIDALSDKWDIK